MPPVEIYFRRQMCVSKRVKAELYFLTRRVIFRRQMCASKRVKAEFYFAGECVRDLVKADRQFASPAPLAVSPHPPSHMDVT